MTDEPQGLPHVHVVRGEPDDVELAALVAGLAAAGQVTDDPAPETPRSAWRDRAHGMRGPSSAARPGPDAWRWSLRS
ncbi:acyl-CoA carboxylase epsilon subunit [Cellulomonas aerilata]|uniref:Acetyl-CoA carboxylase biotin carboxyl carrier protein subunit n=1 Tax=Cellulomonas aerilata TaxID=515326 RepID=A0A512DE51_9CELL|nr:acyl-CoA carboxylase epsilon subunit [Cellulomonas aerilata]GEO34756.1 hypothetical protein CAE01nite_24810 [Cellulomonas aerilata]